MPMKQNNMRKTLVDFIHSHKAILIVMALLLGVRLLGMYQMGYLYSLNSDDAAYVKSGIHFANTGIISMHNEYPSAQIMPGMTVLIGALSLIFGEGTLLWLVLKLLWVAMGSWTAWYIYRSVTLYAPKWCGVLAVLPLFRPDYIWMDNLLLTETPFILCLIAMVYYTLKMGQETQSHRSFWLCALFYMGGLMLKANIAPYPLFALVYLLIVKYDRKLLLKQCGILACIVLLFVIPWSIRNYIRFDTFVPLTYGAGNPTLLGTYQGTGYPLDEELDYETNVSHVVREKYERYYDENGQIKPEFERYVYLQADGVKASYRQKEWLKKDAQGFLSSLLISKPWRMMRSVFYWDTILRTGAHTLRMLPYMEMLFCVAAAIGSFLLKKYRAPILFALGVYMGNIYIYATTFSFDRYNASVVYLRYIAMGIGIAVLLRLIRKMRGSITGRKSQA